VQQGATGKKIQRDKDRSVRMPEINYEKAEKANKKHARANSLGWETKLENIDGGKYKGWSDLWKAGKYNEFADAVAQYQFDNKVKGIDGSLGLNTWGKISGYGEAMAGLESVSGKKANEVCTIATEQRIIKGHKISTGKAFKLPAGKSSKTFNRILQSIEGTMGSVDEQYRGTGAAGAMVYAGFASFVDEGSIWTGALRPGAPMQVWKDRNDYNILKKGVIEYTVKGKLKRRPIKPTDADFSGTSFVFVRYDDPAKPTEMLVRHFGREEWHKKNEYAVWIGANIN
jgi:hypothetical protein